MTSVDKKTALKKVIDSLSDDYLDEAFFFIQDLQERDHKRIQYAKDLLQQEKGLFKRLSE
jgi:hypothetical protein